MPVMTDAGRIGIDRELVSGQSLWTGHCNEADGPGIAHSAIMAATQDESISVLNSGTRSRGLVGTHTES